MTLWSASGSASMLGGDRLRTTGPRTSCTAPEETLARLLELRGQLPPRGSSGRRPPSARPWVTNADCSLCASRSGPLPLDGGVLLVPTTTTSAREGVRPSDPLSGSKAPNNQANTRNSATTSRATRTPMIAPLGPRRCAAGGGCGTGAGASTWCRRTAPTGGGRRCRRRRRTRRRSPRWGSRDAAQLPCHEHGASGDDREETQDDVGHASNVGVGEAPTGDVTCRGPPLSANACRDRAAPARLPWVSDSLPTLGRGRESLGDD